MSETPEEERPIAAPPPEPAPAPPPVQPSPPVQPTAAVPVVAPVYQRRGFQFAAVGVVGLLLGGVIGLGVGLTAGFAFGHHDRPGMGNHQQWGPDQRPRSGHRPFNGRQMPRAPFAPPPRQQPPQIGPSEQPPQISPSPQAS